MAKSKSVYDYEEEIFRRQRTAREGFALGALRGSD